MKAHPEILLLLLSACAIPAAPLEDPLTVDGLIFHRISPARYGKQGPDFYLLETEVTNGQYDAFLQDTGGKKVDQRGPGDDNEWQSDGNIVFWAPDRDSLWTNNHPPQGAEDFPVSLLTVHDAGAYCEWLTRRHPGLGKFRLPTADEWLVAAYGAGRPYPWGTKPDISRVNFKGVGPERVRWRPEGRSPEGLYGLLGNVSEFLLPPDPPKSAAAALAAMTPKNSSGVLPGTAWMGGSFQGTTLTPGQDYWGYWTRSESRSQAVGFRILLAPAGR